MAHSSRLKINDKIAILNKLVDLGVNLEIGRPQPGDLNFSAEAIIVVLGLMHAGRLEKNDPFVLSLKNAWNSDTYFSLSFLIRKPWYLGELPKEGKETFFKGFF